MSIVLAFPNTGLPNPLFKKAGAPDKMPGPIGELPVFAFPKSKRPFYDLGITCIQGFLVAQREKVVLTQPADFYNIFSQVTSFPGLRFSPPQGYFEFNGLSDEQRDQLKLTGLVELTGKPNVFTGCPDFTQMTNVYKLEPFSGKFPQGYSNVEAVLAYNFLIKGLAFYGTVSHTFGYLKGSGYIVDPKESITDKGKMKFDFGAVQSQSEDVSWDVKNSALFNYGQIGPVAVPTDGSRGFTRGYTTSTSPILQKTDSARFFPYFNSMVTPDRGFAFRIFSDIFSQCLLADPMKAADLLSRIRRGYSNLAKTESGMALSHAYMGIHLAKQSHSKITFIITRGEYQGFVLEGEFVIALYSNKIEGVSYVEVQSHIDQLQSHEKALVKISNLFHLAHKADGSPIYPTTPNDIRTSLALVKKYRSLNLDDFIAFPDFKKDLFAVLREVNYESTYQAITGATIENFVRFVSTGDETLLEGMDCWIDGGYLEKCSSDVAFGLSVFGNLAPSISYGGNKEQIFNIPHNLTAQDPNLQIKSDTKKRVLQYFPVKKVNIDNALGHWNSVFNKGVIQIPHGRKGREEFTNKQMTMFEIGGEPGFSTLYRLIKEHSATIRNQKGDGKRGAGGGSGTTGGPSKRPKVTYEGI